MTLSGTAAVAFCLFGGAWAYTELIEIVPYYTGRAYGTAVVMTYFELMIAIGEARIARFVRLYAIKPLKPASVEGPACSRDTIDRMLRGVIYVFSTSGARWSLSLSIASNRQRTTPCRRLTFIHAASFIRPFQDTSVPPPPALCVFCGFSFRTRRARLVALLEPACFFFVRAPGEAILCCVLMYVVPGALLSCLSCSRHLSPDYPKCEA